MIATIPRGSVDSLVSPVRTTIQRYADEMERERHMPLALHRALNEAGLFGIYLPPEFGGLGLSLPEGLKVVEAVATIDGSAGWTVALSFAAAYFSGCVHQDVAREILGVETPLVAGGGKPMRATPVSGGYRVSGQLPYCSGAMHAGWFGGVAQVFDGETPRLGPQGPEMLGWFIPRSGGTVVDTWNVTGLRGTGTHDVLFEDTFVPAKLAFPGNPIAGFPAFRDDPMLRIPFTSIVASIQSPPVCLGLARHAISAFAEIACAKVNPISGLELRQRGLIQAGVGRAEAQVRSARAFYYAAMHDAWDRAAAGKPFSNEDRASVRLAGTFVAENCSQAVDSLFRMAGASAITANSPLERCWRDIHTAAAHIQVQDANWEAAGRVLLGLEPGTFNF